MRKCGRLALLLCCFIIFGTLLRSWAQAGCAQDISGCQSSFNFGVTMTCPTRCNGFPPGTVRNNCTLECIADLNAAYTQCIRTANNTEGCAFPEAVDCTAPAGGCMTSGRDMWGMCSYSCQTPPTLDDCYTKCQVARDSELSQCRADVLSTFPIVFIAGQCVGTTEGCQAYMECGMVVTDCAAECNMAKIGSADKTRWAFGLNLEDLLRERTVFKR